MYIMQYQTPEVASPDWLCYMLRVDLIPVVCEDSDNAAGKRHASRRDWYDDSAQSGANVTAVRAKTILPANAQFARRPEREKREKCSRRSGVVERVTSGQRGGEAKIQSSAFLHLQDYLTCSLGAFLHSYNNPSKEQVILRLKFPQEDNHCTIFPRRRTTSFRLLTNSSPWVIPPRTFSKPPTDLSTAPGCTCSCGASCSCPAGKCTCVSMPLPAGESFVLMPFSQK